MVEVLTSKNIYHDIYKLFVTEQELDDNIKNVHSIDLDKLEDKWLNVVFDYGAIRVQIDITDDPHIVITATDEIKNYVKSVITKEYPNYIKIIK